MLQLSTKQQQALELLGSGAMDKSVCKRLNINRGTLYRWKTTHPRFMAELARRTTLRQQSSNAAACRARDAALKIVLKQLRTQPNRSLDIAVRLLCSPQLARLASSARPTSLQETITQLQSTRPSASSAQDGLTELLTELSTETAAPELPPGPPKPEFPTFQRIHANVAKRKPRPDLYAALIQYGCIEHEITHIVRRPDLLPFDVHYRHFIDDGITLHSGHDLVRLLTEDGPAGITQPLSPRALTAMIKRKLLHRLGTLDLTDCRVGHNILELHIVTADGQNHVFLHDDLWRDFVLGWSCEPQAVSA